MGPILPLGKGHFLPESYMYLKAAPHKDCPRPSRAFMLLRFGKRKLCTMAENVQANCGRSLRGAAARMMDEAFR